MAYCFYNSKSARSLNVKQMKETLVNYCGGDPVEYDKIYDTFRTMALMRFISDREWRRFFNETQGWTIVGDYLYNITWDENGDCQEEIVFDFDNSKRTGREYEEYREGK